MNNLLFYTTHRQQEELYYSSLFFNKSNFLKTNFDIVIHCNNSNYDLKYIKSFCKFETNYNIILTTKNSGYNYGAIEAVSDNFELFKKYDKIIHLHPDCYIINSEPIELILKNNFDVAASEFYHLGRTCFSTDFFIFSSNKNYFLEWDKSNTHVAEHWLYDTLNNDLISLLKYNRFENQLAHRHIDNIGVCHTHDINFVKNILETNL